MASDIWLRTILIVRKETRCRHIGYSYRLTARVLLYAPSHRQDNTYHGLCYTSRGALAGTRNSSMCPTTHRTMSERSTSELRPAQICFGDQVLGNYFVPPHHPPPRFSGHTTALVVAVIVAVVVVVIVVEAIVVLVAVVVVVVVLVAVVVLVVVEVLSFLRLLLII